MQDSECKPDESASEQIFMQLEQDMEPGGVRDLWQSLRRELAEGGPEAVRTYLESEYDRRQSIVHDALQDLASQLEGTI